jgi:hypothetical protein
MIPFVENLESDGGHQSLLYDNDPATHILQLSNRLPTIKAELPLCFLFPALSFALLCTPTTWNSFSFPIFLIYSANIH